MPILYLALYFLFGIASTWLVGYIQLNNYDFDKFAISLFTFFLWPIFLPVVVAVKMGRHGSAYKDKQLLRKKELEKQLRASEVELKDAHKEVDQYLRGL